VQDKIGLINRDSAHVLLLVVLEGIELLHVLVPLALEFGPGAGQKRVN